MKNLIIIISIIFLAFKIEAQPTVNELTPTQFEDIKINNVTLKQIWDTNGDVNMVKSLLGNNVNIINEDNTPGVLSLRFEYPGLALGFTNMFEAEGNLGAFTIESSSVSLTVNERTVKIGDHILKLGSTLKNNDTDGGKSILYVPSNDETVYLYVDYNQSTGIITKIGYFVLT